MKINGSMKIVSNSKFDVLEEGSILEMMGINTTVQELDLAQLIED